VGQAPAGEGYQYCGRSTFGFEMGWQAMIRELATKSQLPRAVRCVLASETRRIWPVFMSRTVKNRSSA